jgi:hypothetical protein
MNKVFFDKERILSSLRSRACTVTFEKKDGSIRKMNCTLSKELMPNLETDNPQEKRKRAENPEVLPVYDLESNGWRSFRWDSVIDFEG